MFMQVKENVRSVIFKTSAYRRTSARCQKDHICGMYTLWPLETPLPSDLLVLLAPTLWSGRHHYHKLRTRRPRKSPWSRSDRAHLQNLVLRRWKSGTHRNCVDWDYRWNSPQGFFSFRLCIRRWSPGSWDRAQAFWFDHLPMSSIGIGARRTK